MMEALFCLCVFLWQLGIVDIPSIQRKSSWVWYWAPSSIVYRCPA